VEPKELKDEPSGWLEKWKEKGENEGGETYSRWSEQLI